MEHIKEIAKSYLSWAPFSLTVREVVRIHSLLLLDSQFGFLSKGRILDVGCGDGNWWKHILPNNLGMVHGIDISDTEVNLAKKVITAQKLDITSSKLLTEISYPSFDTVIGNCSLEHVKEIDLAFKNIYSVLNTGGQFILLVPSPYWALKGHSVQFLNAISPRLSMSASGLLNGFFQHWHLYHYKIWGNILNETGFETVGVYGLGSKKLEFLFRAGLPTAFISFLAKCATGKYLNFFANFIIPDFLKTFLADCIYKSLIQEVASPDGDDIFEYMIICKKK